jgi:hypothetical protein
MQSKTLVLRCLTPKGLTGRVGRRWMVESESSVERWNALYAKARVGGGVSA